MRVVKSVSIDIKLMDKVREYCERHGLSFSRAVSIALERLLEEEERASTTLSVSETYIVNVNEEGRIKEIKKQAEATPPPEDKQPGTVSVSGSFRRYRCESCGHEFWHYWFAGNSKPRCPHCGSENLIDITSSVRKGGGSG